MCGIVGIFAYRAPAVDFGELRRMRDAMQRRGPDGSGEWISEDRRVGLGHRRLAIIDLHERAAQPMHSADGLLHITFNGEIYNYRALREELERKGYVFQTSSDTEVLLHLYRDRGREMLQCLRGMYAFGLWDSQRHSLLLARDALGIKPLYYSHDGECLRFASQVKALIAGGAVSRTPGSAAAVGFYLWGSVPEPHTYYAAIRALPAGESLLIDAAGSVSAARHFSLAQCWADAASVAARSAPCSTESVQMLVRAALRDSVANHLVADVPVSAFLSAGVDSGALVGLMSEQAAQQTQAITLRFAEFAGDHHDEVPLAAAVAQHYGLAHHVRDVQRSELQRDFPRILEAMDQPSIDGINTWFVSKATAELGLKVAISGLGGDELFGGYPTFQTVPPLARALALPGRVPGLGKTLRRALAPLRVRVPRLHPKLASLLELGHSITGAYQLRRGLFLPWELPEVLPEAVVQEGLEALAQQLERLLTPTPRSAWAQVAVLESGQYMRNQLLRDTDWASMAHSLEVRVPLVDHVLLSKLAPSLVHTRRLAGKEWLATSPHKALPDAVRDRPKTGFSTPIATWLEGLPELDAWRAVDSLRSPHTPWARRYAHGLYRLLSQ